MFNTLQLSLLVGVTLRDLASLSLSLSLSLSYLPAPDINSKYLWFLHLTLSLLSTLSSSPVSSDSDYKPVRLIILAAHCYTRLRSEIVLLAQTGLRTEESEDTVLAVLSHLINSQQKPNKTPSLSPSLCRL